MKKSFDVVIAGGGPAGATAGLILARHGMDVLVIEKKKFPRFKLCGGMLTGKTLELGISIMPDFLFRLKHHEVIESKNLNYIISTPDKVLYRGVASQPFVMVDRTKYDQLWMDELKNSGAKVVLDKVVAVKSLKAEVKTAAGHIYKARFVIGADGSGSRIRKFMAQKNIVMPPRSKLSALALETLISRRLGKFSDVPELYVGAVRDGYAWSFPGKERQAVGICSARIKEGKNLKACLISLLNKKGCDGYSHTRIQGHYLPYGDFEKSPGHKNLLLAGDAAGFAEPLLGEGIYYAHASAAISARALIKSYNSPEDCSEVYSRDLKKMISSMRKRLYLRKITMGLPPALAQKTMGLLLPVLAPVLEKIIQGRHDSG